MRKVGLILSAALLIGGAGCKASASGKLHVGGEEKPAPKKVEPKPEPKKEKPKLELKKFKMKGDQLELPGPVVFDVNKTTLRPESDDVLQIVHDYLAATPKVSLLRIEGHTDDVGQDAANQKLSEGRAMAVAKWLKDKGIDCKRLIPVGFGETRPVADNKAEEGKAQNRRTAFVNAELDGKPIGGLPVDGGGTRAGDACK